MILWCFYSRWWYEVWFVGYAIVPDLESSTHSKLWLPKAMREGHVVTDLSTIKIVCALYVVWRLSRSNSRINRHIFTYHWCGGGGMWHERSFLFRPLFSVSTLQAILNFGRLPFNGLTRYKYGIFETFGHFGNTVLTFTGTTYDSAHWTRKWKRHEVRSKWVQYNLYPLI